MDELEQLAQRIEEHQMQVGIVRGKLLEDGRAFIERLVLRYGSLKGAARAVGRSPATLCLIRKRRLAMSPYMLGKMRKMVGARAVHTSWTTSEPVGSDPRNLRNC